MKDAANNGGGAGTNGPPTKPTKRTAPHAVAAAPKQQWMTAQEVAAESRRHHESVLNALRRGLLVGSQSGPKGTWSIERSDFNDWMRRGKPLQRAA
ncbi:hypothetical protein [Amycolatopsis japonica]